MLAFIVFGLKLERIWGGYAHDASLTVSVGVTSGSEW